jgi:hypothetical protein
MHLRCSRDVGEMICYRLRFTPDRGAEANEGILRNSYPVRLDHWQIPAATESQLPRKGIGPERNVKLCRPLSGSFANAQTHPFARWSLPVRSPSMHYFLHQLDCHCLLEMVTLIKSVQGELPAPLDRVSTSLHNE